MEMRFVIGRKKCDEKKLHKLSCEEQRLSFEKKVFATTCVATGWLVAHPTSELL